MSDVFILGAGFSKAISPRMPLMRELTEAVFDHFKGKDQISAEVRFMLSEDFEKALTFLASENPWLPESENLRNRALYLDLTQLIRALLHKKSRGLEVWGSNSPPMWLEALITYWHNNRSTVITLNYDTLIERVAGATHWAKRSKPIRTVHLYPIDLTPAGQRRTTFAAPGAMETFRLFKMHGSINWFYSGRSQFYGENLFFIPCEGGLDGSFDAATGKDREGIHWDHVGDKTALIIPPVLDKTVFFQHESLRSMWQQAGQAIRGASRIVCMGYSLPTGDLTMAQFLKTAAPQTPIPFQLVDSSPKVEHFRNVIGGVYEFQQGYEGPNSVAAFVIKECIPDEQDRVYVSHMTQWHKSELKDS